MRAYQTNVKFMDGEYWYVQPSDGRRRRLAAHKRKNDNRMFVHGHYIPTSNVLRVPGTYESFGEAAFTNLAKKEQRVEGHVYLIHNPRFPGWVKVGRAYDPVDRLASYQTSSPHRDYQLLHSFHCGDARQGEREAHDMMESACIERSGEWFLFPHTDDAMEFFTHVEEEICN